MTIAGAILLIVAGAILTFATNVDVQGLNLDIVGWILMIAGGAGLVLAFFQEAIWTERGRRQEAAAAERERAAREASPEVPPREAPPRY